jgi:hypothetical protein
MRPIQMGYNPLCTPVLPRGWREAAQRLGKPQLVIVAGARSVGWIERER